MTRMFTRLELKPPAAPALSGPAGAALVVGVPELRSEGVASPNH